MSAINLPILFTDRMKAALGPEYEAFAASYNRPMTPALRVNTLKADPRTFAVRMSASPPPADPSAAALPDSDLRLRGSAPWTLCPVPWCPSGYYYGANDHPGKHPLHDAGVYYIQEPSAMIVAEAAAPRPGEWILDLCAAPGGKTTALGAALSGQGLLVANEIEPGRASILSQNVERMGLANVIVTNEAPGPLAGHFPHTFDKIIVDAPCSGEGMFRKEPQALAHWSMDNIQLCASRQAEILEAARNMLKPDGMIIYSTCTFAHEECEDTVASFIARFPEFTAVDVGTLRPALAPFVSQGHVWPHKVDGEGHFVAILVRGTPAELRAETCAATAQDDIISRLAENANGEAGEAGSIEANCSERNEYEKNKYDECEYDRSKYDINRSAHDKFDKRNVNKSKTDNYKSGKDKNRKNAASNGGITRQQAELWQEFAAENLQKSGHSSYISSNPNSYRFDPLSCPAELTAFGDNLYLVPSGVNLRGVKVLRAGLQLGSTAKGRFEPSHALALALKPNQVRRTLAIDTDTAAAYQQGQTIPTDGENGWTLVTLEGYPVGWGKVSNRMCKNHYPKGLRRYC